MHVVATAGHVDHGKSSLVRALTGQDPDRLAEERERGLSIQLGYCWTLTIGSRAGEVAFVDVPGHERFLTTTLSGLGPASVAMLVVAADDPWMPQAAEHLAALDGLGVRHGLVAVTRSDLADPVPMVEEARRRLAATSLAGAPAVAVSAHTGAGLDELRATLDAVLGDVPAPPAQTPVRLWLDRRFHVRGVGTVVTGTLPAGRIARGDRLETAAGPVRVRGLESLERPRDSVTGAARVALAITGAGVDALGAGDVVVTPGSLLWSDVVDVRLGGDGPLPQQPMLHVGSAALAVRARPLGETHARLALPTPVPLRIGDRALLRDPGSRALWSAEVLDCGPPPLARRGAGRARATELSGWRGTEADLARSRGVVDLETLDRLGARACEAEPGAVAAEGWLVSAARAEEARRRLTGLVTEAGLPLDAAARALELPAAVVAELVGAPLALERGRVTRPGSGLDPRLAQALRALRADLEQAPFAAPAAARLAELGLDPAAVTALHRRGELLHVGSSVVLLPTAPDEAVRRLAALEQPFTTSQARTALETSRRVVLPLLAHLDRAGRTLRLPDDRRRLR